MSDEEPEDLPQRILPPDITPGEVIRFARNQPCFKTICERSHLLDHFDVKTDITMTWANSEDTRRLARMNFEDALNTPEGWNVASAYLLSWNLLKLGETRQATSTLIATQDAASGLEILKCVA